MAVSLKHAFDSPVADEQDPELVGPDEWNAEHVLTQAGERLLGKASAGDGATEELTVDLEAGSYVLVCNIPAHYRQGMSTPFTVT